MAVSDNSDQSPQVAQNATANIMEQAAAELAQTESAWKEIESVISYDADQPTVTVSAVARPTQPVAQISTSAPAPPQLRAQPAPLEHTEPTVSPVVGSVFGETMTGRVSNIMRVVVRVASLAAIAGVVWYVYTAYIAS